MCSSPWSILLGSIISLIFTPWFIHMFLIKSAQAFYGLDQKQCWAFSYTVKRERTKIALLVPAQGPKWSAFPPCTVSCFESSKWPCQWRHRHHQHDTPLINWLHMLHFRPKPQISIFPDSIQCCPSSHLIGDPSSMDDWLKGAASLISTQVGLRRRWWWAWFSSDQWWE